MNPPIIRLVIAALAAILIPGCATNQVPSPAVTRPTAATIGTVVLGQTKDAAKRKEVANYLYAAATAIRTLTGTETPTPERLQQTILSFVPKADPVYVNLAATLAAHYGAAYVKLPVGSPQLQAFLEALASGLEDAAAPWLPRSAGLREEVRRMRDLSRDQFDPAPNFMRQESYVV